MPTDRRAAGSRRSNVRGLPPVGVRPVSTRRPSSSRRRTVIDTAASVKPVIAANSTRLSGSAERMASRMLSRAPVRRPRPTVPTVTRWRYITLTANVTAGMNWQNLHDGWTVRAVDGEIPPEVGDRPWPATVPGTVHTDLLSAGLIPDPYTGLNETSLAWLHRSSWVYSRKLHIAPAAAGERVDLVFDGLDTVATVSLGDRVLGRTANMHRGYRFDVRSATAAPTTLSVRFDSALAYAEAMRERLGARPCVYEHPFNFVRKMACSFGWDWGPDLQTAGIWKPVRLERWRVARLAEVRPLATLDADGSTGRLQTHVEIERSGLEPARDLTIRVDVHGVTGVAEVPAGTDRAVVELAVPNAPVWWPAGHGEQPLCPVTVELVDTVDVLHQYT